MRFELDTTLCEKCIGLDKCNRSCVLHSGKALVDFIQRVDMVETRIGEYSSRKKDTKPDLVVSGHQIYGSDSPSWLLTDISTILDMSAKIEGVYDKTAVQVATIYCKHIGMEPDEIENVTNKIKAINKNKAFIIPFKPKTSCKVAVEYQKSTKREDAEISYVKWVTNKETHKIECFIGFAVKGAISTTNIKLPITDYMDKFKLSQMLMQSQGNKHDPSLIKVTDYGMIRPIEIEEGSAEIAIDGTYVYYTTMGETRIIGYWNKKDELVVDKTIKSKAITKIKENERYIRNHKKYIAPYMMLEPNTIKVK